MPIRVAVVVAGSIGFTRRQVQDILGVPELQDIEFAFTDINERNLDTGIAHIRPGARVVGWRADHCRSYVTRPVSPGVAPTPRTVSELERRLGGQPLDR